MLETLGAAATRPRSSREPRRVLRAAALGDRGAISTSSASDFTSTAWSSSRMTDRARDVGGSDRRSRPNRTRRAASLGPRAGDLLVLNAIHKRWGKLSVLEGVDLSVPRGSLVSVCGANGTGKTTLLRIAAGLIHPESGTVALDGLHPERDRRAYLARLGFLSAGDRSLYARLSARRHLDLCARLALMPAGERGKRGGAGARRLRARGLRGSAGRQALDGTASTGPAGDDVRPRPRPRPPRRAREQPRPGGLGGPGGVPRAAATPGRCCRLVRPGRHPDAARSRRRAAPRRGAASTRMTGLTLTGHRSTGRLELVRAHVSATAGIVRRDATIRMSYRGRSSRRTSA